MLRVVEDHKQNSTIAVQFLFESSSILFKQQRSNLSLPKRYTDRKELTSIYEKSQTSTESTYLEPTFLDETVAYLESLLFEWSMELQLEKVEANTPTNWQRRILSTVPELQNYLVNMLVLLSLVAPNKTNLHHSQQRIKSMIQLDRIMPSTRCCHRRRVHQDSMLQSEKGGIFWVTFQSISQILFVTQGTRMLLFCCK